MSELPKKPRTRLRWTILFVWLVICAFTILLADRGLLRPIYQFLKFYPGTDKAGHFVLIGGLAGLLNLALELRTVRWRQRDWLLGSVLVAVVFTIEEVSQYWLPERSFDVLDLAGDYTGIIFFGWLAKVGARRRGQL